MLNIPERHPAIPKTASWSSAEEIWEDCALDEAGQLHGEYQSYRRDGSSRLCCSYRHGERSGPFRIYHPSGELAREGHFLNGVPDGVVVAYRSDGASPEGLRACCVPNTARLMQAEYASGRLIRERFFDAEGRLLLPDGSVVPERPLGVPDGAEYDDTCGLWVVVHVNGELTDASYFNESGRLVHDEAYRAGQRFRVRHFARDASVRREEHLDSRGRLHGKRLVRYIEDEASPFEDSKIVIEVSEFEHDQPVRKAECRTLSGQSVFVDRGGAVREPGALEHVVFGEHQKSGGEWSCLAQELAAAGDVRFALCAAARAMAADRRPETFMSWLRRSVVPLRADLAHERAQELDSETSELITLLSGLLLGATPAVVLRGLAKILPNQPRAAHDFVEAALVLSPEDADSYWVRAMRRIELGRLREALRDIDHVAAGAEPAAEFMRKYVALLFPCWRFNPALEPVQESFEGMSETPMQALDRIRRTIQVYATRLQHLRRAALRRLDSAPLPLEEPEWLAPELPHLLPNGPIELLRYQATIVDVCDDGELCSEVEVDEGAGLGDAPLVELQARARAEWAALTWLCWAAGLQRVALPEQLKPPADYAAAASMCIARAARAQDAVCTGGLRARAQGLPGFDWEGYAIDEAPRSLMKVALGEYSELRAMFLWLSFSENSSPFQSDLRDSSFAAATG